MECASADPDAAQRHNAKATAQMERGMKDISVKHGKNGHCAEISVGSHEHGTTDPRQRVITWRAPYSPTIQPACMNRKLPISRQSVSNILL
jgi:hypothetical protein